MELSRLNDWLQLAAAVNRDFLRMDSGDLIKERARQQMEQQP